MSTLYFNVPPHVYTGEDWQLVRDGAENYTWDTSLPKPVALRVRSGNDVPGFIGEYTNNVSISWDPQSNFLNVFVHTPEGDLIGVAECPNPVGSGSQTCNGVLKLNGTVVNTTVTFKGSSVVSINVSGGTVSFSGTVAQQISQAPTTTGAQWSTSDPISTATGGLDSGPFVDLSLGGPLPLVLRRFYSSGLGVNFGQNAIGYNWTTNFDPYLGISGNVAVVALEGGGTVSFQLSGGTYQTVYAPRLAYQFVKTTTSYRFLNPENNLIYDFDSNGFLTKIEDRNGNALTITRGLLGVTQVADGLGRTLTFSYANTGAQPSVTKVQDQSGRSVSFTHDANYNLTGITDANGNTTTYSYSGSLLAKTVRPRGNAPYTQGFDPATGAAVTQTDSEGNTTTLSYVTGGTPGITTMTIRSAGRLHLHVWRCEPRGNLTKFHGRRRKHRVGHVRRGRAPHVIHRPARKQEFNHIRHRVGLPCIGYRRAGKHDNVDLSIPGSGRLHVLQPGEDGLSRWHIGDVYL